MDEHTDMNGDAPRIVAVRLRGPGPVHDFDAGDLPLRAHDRVLVETDRGPTLGTVVAAPLRRTPRRRLRRVIDLAEARDLSHEDRLEQRSREMLHAALRIVRERDLPIKLVKIERDDEATKTTLVYTCEEKFQHRDLARELSRVLGVHLEMRHIGARDEARVAGGVGVCGRELCCSSWLKSFEGVSVKMAKAQNLSLNFSKLAGQCGRLKCCLRYEYQTYVELKRDLPRIGAIVESVRGSGKVVKHQLLRQTVTIRRDDDELVEVTLEDLVERRPDA
jgi:cell fate regulator YaaT (PSP1 superfamily)